MNIHSYFKVFIKKGGGYYMYGAKSEKSEKMVGAGVKFERIRRIT